jgi:MFS family permease
MNALTDFFGRLTMKPQGITVVVAAFLPIFAIVSMFPVVSSMIDHFALNPDAKWQVPLMVSAPGLTIALFAPFAGYFIDNIGRRKLLLWATFFYGIFGTAPFFLDNLTAIFATRLLLGVCEAAILTGVNTLIGDYWDQDGRRNWLFIQGVVGPFMASGVIAVAGPMAAIRWNGSFLIYLIAFPIFLAMLVFLFEPKKVDASVEAASAPATAFPLRAALEVGAVTLFASALYYVFIINGSLVFKELGVSDPAQVSALTYIPSLFIMFGALMFWSLGAWSNAVQIMAFMLALGGGLAAVGLVTSPSQMQVAMALQQTGAGMAVPTLIAWAQTKFPFEHRGRGMGIWSGCFFFGQFSSPWLVHKLNDSFGSMQWAFLIAGLVGLAGAGVALFNHVRAQATA